jgi:hypothetical protein
MPNASSSFAASALKSILKRAGAIAVAKRIAPAAPKR